jgi:hypothetical protein
LQDFPYPVAENNPVSRRSLHVVYCLTSSGGDLYEAMTRLSLATVQLTNPSARVTIACDQQTHQALLASDSQLLHEANAIRGFPAPEGPPTYRNRFVKTQLGRLIDGPFLFLDSDTVVRKPLTTLLDLHCDIAAAPNHSRDTLAEQIWSEDQENLDAMGWKVSKPYVNGGVIWFSGTAGSNLLADDWHHFWQNSFHNTGRERDQPALNYALHSGICISFKMLPHEFNAQYLCNIRPSRGAHIWHAHYSSEVPGREKDVIVRAFKKARYMTDARAIKSLAAKVLESKSPYIDDNSTIQGLREAIKSFLSFREC